MPNAAPARTLARPIARLALPLLASSLLALSCAATEAPRAPGAADAHEPAAGHGAAASHMSPHGHASPHEGASAHGAESSVDAQLAEVARIHGAAGPWAVAGYRMGRYALRKLGLPPQSFDLEVIHHSPQQVEFSCIADGAAAATGASLGKLNLRLAEADAAHVATTYRRASTGASLTLRPTTGFRARFQSVPREELPAAGRIVMELPEGEVFEEVK